MLRERLTITLEPDLVAAADALVDKSSIRNRSHALEHLIKEGLGLHLLRQAFVFVGDGWTQSQAEGLARLCEAQGISTVYLCGRDTADLRLLFTQADLQDVPLDFGSGGAVLLRQAELEHPFLLAWLDASLTLPESLVGAYAQHRRQNLVATQLLAGDGASYRPSGLAIAGLPLLPHIPAGIASLEGRVFPELLKTGKLSTYAF